MIPDQAACLRLMDQYRMPPHIRAHSLLVARVAECLARALVARGEPIRVELVVAGALLHDLAKVLCLDGDCSHAELGAELCREHGYEELVPLVMEHVHLRDGFTGRCGEREIVFYADKRVNHDRLVSLEERRNDVIRRYAPRDKERQAQIWQNFDLCRRLEEHLFARLAMAPDELGDCLAVDGVLEIAAVQA
ncbi:HD domain-containing protein [Desulfurivibrio dismutans]|uniref:HD domain-containing protein n=1 Tax=Desulfurivibrio dismutans TaxID=1398908 RepID=UPI0023DB1980|nr:HD domain-containing protein [Desulfurivibrio alkaliphilus]MDF1614006.1 HDIG domain-containing protein [Desulfurivibrio alkaliphilus]